MGLGCAQDGAGANSGSLSAEPQTIDVAADTSSAEATVGMAPEGDGGDGAGPSGLGATADCEVTDLTGHSGNFAQVRMHALACVVLSSWL